MRTSNYYKYVNWLAKITAYIYKTFLPDLYFSTFIDLVKTKYYESKISPHNSEFTAEELASFSRTQLTRKKNTPWN